MLDIVQQSCPYCHMTPVFSENGCYDERDNEYELAVGGWTELLIGVDKNGKVVMRACDDDDYTEDYYPKYCPECGRKLNNKEEEND